MICPKCSGKMTKAGKGKRKGLGHTCQKWQCLECGHVVMENPAVPVNPITGHELAQPEPEKKVELLTSASDEGKLAVTGHSQEPA